MKTMTSPRILYASAIAVAVGFSSLERAAAAPFQLEKLPYGYDALEPMIGKKTLLTHHTKHHQKYVNTANQLIEKDPILSQKDDLTLEHIITSYADNVGLYNNAAQIWNHSFYWKCMKPSGGGKPSPGELAGAIAKDFGSFEELKGQLTTAALTAFGSGWAWLGYDGKRGKLVVTKTTGAGNPLTDGVTPILTIDVWEHAYYLDYQQDRPGYVNDFFTKLVNWEFAERNYDAAVSAATIAKEL